MRSVLLVLAACAGAPGPTAPPAPAAVGVQTIAITDAARRDPVDAAHERQWMIDVYYPAVATASTDVYAADPVLLDTLIHEGYYETPEADLRAWAHRPAAAIARARPAGGAPRPVVTLSPGLGFARLNYAVLAAALVRHGYAVLVIDHPYLGYSHLPDGRITRTDQDAALTSDSPADALPRVRDWARDVSVVLDRLARDPIAGLALDLDHIVAAGHSIGGTAAVEVCTEEPRAIACLDFEGFLEGTRAVEQGAAKPTLAVFSRAKGRPPTVKPGEPDPAVAQLAALARAGQPAWIVKVTGGSHTSFSDAPEVMPHTLSRFGGELMPAARSFALYTGLVDAFARAVRTGDQGVFRRFVDGAPEVRARTEKN